MNTKYDTSKKKEKIVIEYNFFLIITYNIPLNEF